MKYPTRTTTDNDIIENLPGCVRRLINDLHTYPNYRGQSASDEGKKSAERLGLINCIVGQTAEQDVAMLTVRGSRIAAKTKAAEMENATDDDTDEDAHAIREEIERQSSFNGPEWAGRR